MENCLLFGNGINRCYNGLSWHDLLTQIANTYFVSGDTSRSATITYEKIANDVLRQNMPYTNVKITRDNFAYDILKTLDNLREGYQSLYQRFLNLPVTDILTTNYDYAIERSLSPDFIYEEQTKNVVMPQEIRCSCIRHICIKNKRIFHIHGELSKPSSICLGVVHYATNLSKLMERIVVVDDYGNASLINDIFSLNKLKTWAEFFFTKNIYIVGLSLDDCDFDLWWLITYRSQLLRTGHTQINNKIIYFYTYEKGHRNDEFVSCLSAMNIDVKHKEVPPNGWIAAYQDIANRIKLELS